jgi:6-phosphogluconolactonase (cycloisomerase 2 family)
MSWKCPLTVVSSRRVVVGTLVLAVSIGGTKLFAQSSFAYVTSQGDSKITAYKLAGNGRPTVIDSYSTVGPNGAAVTPNGRFLYIANYGTPGCSTPGTVSAFAINPENGRLTPVQGSPFSTGLGPYSVTVSSTGRFVYTANHCANNISAFQINPASGALIPITGSPFATGQGPLFVTIDGTGRHAYVDNTTDDTITQYDVEDSGALTTTGAPVSSQGRYPGRVTLAHSGRFAYVANSGS